MADRPHFAAPFVRKGGKVAVVEQSTPEHITAKKWMVVSTPLGWRIERPDFGWPWPEFSPVPIDTSSLATALSKFVTEDHSSIEEWAEVYDQAARKIRITQERS